MKPRPPHSDQIKARAAQVAAMMRRAGPDHFDMDHWYNDRMRPDAALKDLCYVGEIDINNCGTTACLGGFAALAITMNCELPQLVVNGDPYGLVPSHLRIWFGMPNARMFYETDWTRQVELERNIAAGNGSTNPEFDAILTVLDNVAEHGDWRRWCLPIDQLEELGTPVS